MPRCGARNPRRAQCSQVCGSRNVCERNAAPVVAPAALHARRAARSAASAPHAGALHATLRFPQAPLRLLFRRLRPSQRPRERCPGSCGRLIARAKVVSAPRAARTSAESVPVSRAGRPFPFPVVI
jgi:hypothetical protein